MEIQNFYRKRMAEGYPEAEVLRSIYAKGRDNARTPMQWTAGENAGFTTGTPWLPVNPNHTVINAEAELADPDSVFACYRQLIALRKSCPVLVDGDFTLLEPDHPNLFVYERAMEGQRLLVVCNFGGEPTPWTLPEAWRNARVLVENCPAVPGVLQPWEARMLYRNDG